MANEEPLVVMKAGINIVGEIIRKNGGDSRGGVIREGKTPLRRGGGRGVCKRTLRAEDGDVSRDWGIGVHRGSEVLALRGGDEDVVGVDGDIFVERGEEEGVENFLGYTWGSGRHG